MDLIALQSKKQMSIQDNVEEEKRIKGNLDVLFLTEISVMSLREGIHEGGGGVVKYTYFCN